MTEVDIVKKERDTLEEQLKASSMDMASKFLQALAADGFIDVEKISDQGLEDSYGSFQMEVEESIVKQEVLLNKIQVNTGSCSTFTYSFLLDMPILRI